MQAENPDENQKVGSDSDDTDEDDEEGDGLVGRPPASSSPGAAAHQEKGFCYIADDSQLGAIIVERSLNSTI